MHDPFTLIPKNLAQPWYTYISIDIDNIFSEFAYSTYREVNNQSTVILAFMVEFRKANIRANAVFICWPVGTAGGYQAKRQDLAY